MISLDDFKKYLGWSQNAVPAKKSIGLVVLTRTNPTGTIIPIPQNLVYFAGGQSFTKTGSINEINESQLMVEVTLTARHEGEVGNISANQMWTVDQNVDFDVTNPTPFSGGAEAIEERSGLVS